MAINLDEHKVYVESHKMEMVPLSIAIAAIEQASNLQAYQAKLDEAMKMMNDAFKDINNSVEGLDD
jgi:predicted small secreted protein